MPTLYFRGICKWAKVYKPDPEYNNYSVVLYPDKESLKKYKESGLRLQIKEDDDGKNITFRRPHEKQINGENVVFGPPGAFLVTNKETSEYEKTTDLIGNGSDVVLKVSTYDAGSKGKGHRLEGILVYDLVKYEPKEFNYKFETKEKVNTSSAHF